MREFLSKLLDTSDFPARWRCGNWDDGHGWLHILSDLGVWSAYVAIPIALIAFAARRKHVPFRNLFWLFSAFILACGTTHLMEAIIFWWPAYRLAGVIKLFTAVVSWATVLTLLPVIPRAFAMRTPEELEREIAERVAAELALRASEERFRTVIAHIPCGVVWKDRDSVYRGGNAEGARDLGLPWPEALVGHTDRELTDDPDRAAAYRAADQQVMDTGVPLLDVEETRPRPSGETAVLLTSKLPLRDEAGAVIGVLGVSQDVTDRKRLEEHVREKQKMEAVGHLAGGVAHDFNNLLTVINGYVELLLAGHALDPRTVEILTEVQGAGARAADLTRQLLAFSRRSVLRPKLIDLNDLIRNVEKMLARLIGEDVRLSTSLRPSAGRVRVDPGQIEQVIVNLVVNARDAMPTGGKLTIETDDVELDEAYARTHPDATPGRYTRLSVTDTGCGMTDAVKARVFEPFFTTKEVGKGTGLGLATVYGIVRQSGGHVTVASEVGRGTAFKVYLPVADTGAAASAEQSLVRTPPPQGTETVLLVEDEARVRAMTGLALRRAGYKVVEAGCADEAGRVWQERAGAVDLLLTDVVMPGPSGRELAERLTAADPDLKVLFMSGYTDDAVVRHGLLVAEVEFIQKPFVVDTMLRKVRTVLDA